MNEIKDNYIIVHSWMSQQLKINGNSLMIFALIHGYTERGSVCNCGIDYMRKWFDISKSGVIKIINELDGLGYIERVDCGENDKRKKGLRSKVGPKSIPNYAELGLENRPSLSTIGLENRPSLDGKGLESVPNSDIGLESGLIQNVDNLPIGTESRPNVYNLGLENRPSSGDVENKVHFLDKIGPQNGPYNSSYISDEDKSNINTCAGAREEWKTYLITICMFENQCEWAKRTYGTDYAPKNILDIILDFLAEGKGIEINDTEYTFDFIAERVRNIRAGIFSNLVQYFYVKDESMSPLRWKQRHLSNPTNYIIKTIINETK